MRRDSRIESRRRNTLRKPREENPKEQQSGDVRRDVYTNGHGPRGAHCSRLSGGEAGQRLHGFYLAERACVALEVAVVATARDDLYGRIELELRPVEQSAVLRGNLVVVNCEQLVRDTFTVYCSKLPTLKSRTEVKPRLRHIGDDDVYAPAHSLKFKS